MFYTNQAKLFEIFEKENESKNLKLESQDSIKIWSEMWDQPVKHDNKVQWLKKVESRLRGAKTQENMTENH